MHALIPQLIYMPCDISDRFLPIPCGTRVKVKAMCNLDETSGEGDRCYQPFIGCSRKYKSLATPYRDQYVSKQPLRQMLAYYGIVYMLTGKSFMCFACRIDQYGVLPSWIQHIFIYYLQLIACKIRYWMGSLAANEYVKIIYFIFKECGI